MSPIWWGKKPLLPWWRQHSLNIGVCYYVCGWECKAACQDTSADHVNLISFHRMGIGSRTHTQTFNIDAPLFRNNPQVLASCASTSTCVYATVKLYQSLLWLDSSLGVNHFRHCILQWLCSKGMTTYEVGYSLCHYIWKSEKSLP